MLLRTRTLPYAMMAILALTTACGGSDDSGTDPGGDAATGNPTTAEVQGMTSALQALFASGAWFGSPSSEALAAQFAGQTVSQSFNHTVNCPAGGTTATTGNVTYTVSGQNNITYSGNVTSQFSSCKATGNGTVFTFTGSGLTLNINMSINGQSYTYDFKESGNINWAGNSKSGTCPINITIHATYGGSGIPSATVSGTYCGQTV